MSAPLWEARHPYYASESNFFSNDYTTRYADWDEFIDSEGCNDRDMNCLFRWDWRRSDPRDYDLDLEEVPGDEVQLTFILQRKGVYRVVLVPVTEADEPAVRRYLTGAARHIASLWGPFLNESMVAP